MHDDEHNGEHQDARPFLVIPYWPATATDPGDTGSARPVPTTVPWYMCGGIRTSTYQPGQVLEVAVDVRNFGGSNAPSLAQVTVWWTDPTLGFLVKPENLIGFRTVPVPPRGGTATTAIMAKEIPASAPDHICLLARVSHQLDTAPPLPDPVNDRHWAQRNLSVVTVTPGAPATLSFVVTNFLADAATFRIRMAPVEHVEMLAGTDGVDGRPLTDVQATMRLGDRSGEGRIEIDVGLSAGEVRELDAEIVVPALDDGSFVAFEISQMLGDTTLGGLGLVVVADADR